MQIKLQINRDVFGQWRQGRNFGAAGARAPENLVRARLRRLSVIAAKNRTGLSALFTGSSRTGKTMAAALAKTLGKHLHRVDLTTVKTNYIGETEKNLSYLFAVARKRNAVLFFDEADALFGKRTEVKDSHDSYANLEVSHLLARIARHRGIVILSTNTRTDIDPAIARRFDAVVRFQRSDEGPSERSDR